MSLYQSIELYDLFYNQRKEIKLRGHYEELFSGKNIKSIHDCSFGTGDLTMVLSDMGYKVSGSDLSEEMLEAGMRKAEERSLDINLFKSDFRHVKDKIEEPLDLWISTGNSLPHIPNGEVKATIKEWAACIKEGGYIYLDLRNWDKIVDEKQRFYTYNPYIMGDTTVNLVQVWDHSDDCVVFNLLYTFLKDNKIYRKETVTTTYYPLKKDLLIEALEEAGFVDIEINELVLRSGKPFEELDWYTVMARKG